MSMHKRQEHATEDHVGELLSAYIDGRLTPGERLRVETHLPVCEECRADLVSIQATVGLLKSLPIVATPRPFYVYPDMVPARRSRFDLGAIFKPGWAYGMLRLATSAAAILLVVVLAADAMSLSAPRAAAPAFRTGAQSESATPSLMTTDTLSAAEPTAPARAAAPRAAMPTTDAQPTAVPAPAAAPVARARHRLPKKPGPTPAPQAPAPVPSPAASGMGEPPASALAAPTATAATAAPAPPVAGLFAVQTPADAQASGSTAPAPAPAPTEVPRAGPATAEQPVPATAVAAPSPAEANAGKSAVTTEPGRQGAGLGGGEPSAEAATYGDAARDDRGHAGHPSRGDRPGRAGGVTCRGNDRGPLQAAEGGE